MKIISPATLVAIALAAGCGGDSTGTDGDCTPGGNTVCMVNSLYDPATLTIQRGSNVDWVNVDPLPHSVTSSPGNPAECPTFDIDFAPRTSGSATAARQSFATNAAVTCNYYCNLHATPTTGAMRGSIVRGPGQVIH